MISREKRFLEYNTGTLQVTCQVFSTVSNCRKCVAFFLKDVEMRDESIKERVPDQPKPEESLDSRDDITEFEPEKAVNKNGGQDTTEEKNLCDKQSLSGNEKEEVKTGEEAKEEKTGGVSLFSCFYLFHVAEAHLNAIQTSQFKAKVATCLKVYP